MADYRFVTTWLVDAPIEDAWEAILHSERWPEWWQGVEAVTELEPGEGGHLGCLQRYTWKSKLPYRLNFEMRVTRVEPPNALEGAAGGELEGTGRWRLSEDPQGTLTTYIVMRQGGESLARLLGTRAWAPIGS